MSSYPYTPDSSSDDFYMCFSKEAFEDLVEVRDCLTILAGVTVDGKRNQPMVTVPRFALAKVFRRFAADLDEVLGLCLTEVELQYRRERGRH